MIIPNAYATPRFYNKKVQEINTDLDTLGWIDSIFPIAKVGIDDEGTFPEVYKNDGSKTSVRIFPTGNSLSFFTINGSPTQIEETEMYTVGLSLLVWADLTKVDSTKEYDYTDELINQCRITLNRHSCYDYSIDLEDVFADYDQLDKVINQNVMLPYTAFRINFSCDVLMCLSTDTKIIFEPTSFGLWALPSLNLSIILGQYLYDNYANNNNWHSSSEYNSLRSYYSSDNGFGVYISKNSPKSNTQAVRAARSFLAPLGYYSIGDTGPNGVGEVFYISGTTYYEENGTDLSIVKVWSNITDTLIGTTGTAIGTGAVNTLAIINQDTTADDWYLPSIDELEQIYINLYLNSVGGFGGIYYWSSSEASDTTAKRMTFDTGVKTIVSKYNYINYYVRAIRTFTDSVGAYSLRSTGPAGGLIFYIDGTTYYEAAPSDQSTGQAWSNITAAAIGTTSTAIGTGQANTTAIIAQAGFTDGAAKTCDDLTTGSAFTDGAAKLCNDLN